MVLSVTLHCAALPQPPRVGCGRAGVETGVATGSSGGGPSSPPKMLEVWLFDCVQAASIASAARPAMHAGLRIERSRLGSGATAVRCQ
jgi:hypothetical protein